MTMPSNKRDDQLREQLSSIFFDDDYPILTNQGAKRLDEAIALINQQIKSVLDELEGEAVNYPLLSGDNKLVIMESTIQKIRSRYE